MTRYRKLGTVMKRNGMQIWEYYFDYSLLEDAETEVFVKVKPRGYKSARGIISLRPGETAEGVIRELRGPNNTE